jgi:hypothetical protein
MKLLTAPESTLTNGLLDRRDTRRPQSVRYAYRAVLGSTLKSMEPIPPR